MIYQFSKLEDERCGLRIVDNLCIYDRLVCKILSLSIYVHIEERVAWLTGVHCKVYGEKKELFVKIKDKEIFRKKLKSITYYGKIRSEKS